MCIRDRYRGQLDFKGTFIQFGHNGQYWPTITNMIQQLTYIGNVFNAGTPKYKDEVEETLARNKSK